MIQQNTKKLIESQTKKLFIISLALFFLRGIFSSSLNARKMLFVRFEAEFISNLKIYTKNITVKTLLA